MIYEKIVKMNDGSTLVNILALSEEVVPTNYADGSLWLASDTHEEFVLINGVWKSKSAAPEIPKPEKANFYVNKYNDDGEPIDAETFGVASITKITAGLEKFKSDATSIAGSCFPVATNSSFKELIIPKVDYLTRNAASGGTASGFTNLEYVDISDVDSVNESMFKSASKLKIVKSDNVKRLRNYCFGDCTSLEYANFPKVESSWQFGDFQNCLNLVWADLRNYYGSEVYTWVTAWKLFSNCQKLETVVLGTCTGPGSSAFYNCNSLKCLDIRRCPTVWSGYSNAFDGITKDFKTIDLIVPDNLYDDYCANETWNKFNIVKASDAPEDPLLSYKQEAGLI